MTPTGAWHCEWPACPRLATTQLRTSMLPWMKVCRQHRTVWLNCTIELLEAAYRQRQPPRHDPYSATHAATKTSPPRPISLISRLDHHRPRHH